MSQGRAAFDLVPPEPRRAGITHKTGVANHFWHDAQLRRYAMRDNNGLTYFTWDANGMNLLAERDVDGTLAAGYTHGTRPSMASAPKYV